VGATINQSTGTRPYLYERYASGMAKKRKFQWDRRPCGCVITKLSIGPAIIRCAKHEGKPDKKGRVVLRFTEEGLVRAE